MKKERDWVDYAGLFSSVMQNAQLGKIESHLEQANNLTLTAIQQQNRQSMKQEIRQNVEADFQNRLWNMMQALERSQKDYANEPLKFAFALFALTPKFSATAFDNWDNKQRLKSYCDELGELKEQTKAKLGEPQFDDVVKCTRAIEGLKDLNRFILMERLDLEYKEKLKPLKNELAEVEAQHKAEPIKFFRLSSWVRVRKLWVKVNQKRTQIENIEDDGQFRTLMDVLTTEDVTKWLTTLGSDILARHIDSQQKVNTMEDEAKKAKMLIALDKNGRKLALLAEFQSLKEQFQLTYEEAIKYRMELLEAAVRCFKYDSVKEAEQQILGENKPL
jgi:hypothetical protein